MTPELLNILLTVGGMVIGWVIRHRWPTPSPTPTPSPAPTPAPVPSGVDLGKLLEMLLQQLLANNTSMQKTTNSVPIHVQLIPHTDPRP